MTGGLHAADRAQAGCAAQRRALRRIARLAAAARRALLRREGGDRVMAQVLAAVPDHGLEAVLVAVDLVLEAGRPSAEHVLNVLARLRDGPPPQTVETRLTVTVPPAANTQRYDTLRDLPEVSHS